MPKGTRYEGWQTRKSNNKVYRNIANPAYELIQNQWGPGAPERYLLTYNGGVCLDAGGTMEEALLNAEEYIEGEARPKDGGSKDESIQRI